MGAGAGSIVEWLGTRVGQEGSVVVVDRKTAYLRRFSSAPYRVIEGDVLDLALEGKVDLLHARYVLIHNKQDREILRKIQAVVRPGGFVVLEEPDFTSTLWLNPGGDAADQRVNESICRMFTNAGLDPAYGLGLPHKMAESGFDILRTRATIHLCNGNAPIAKVMAESALVLRKESLEPASPRTRTSIAMWRMHGRRNIGRLTIRPFRFWLVSDSSARPKAPKAKFASNPRSEEVDYSFRAHG